MFLYTNYEIIVTNNIEYNLKLKFEYVINEIKNNLSDEQLNSIGKYYKPYLLDLEKFIQVGGNIENLNKSTIFEDKDILDYSGLKSFWHLNMKKINL